MVMSLIDDTIDKIIAEKNEAIAKLEWWRNEAESWRSKALELDAQLESTVAKLTARISRIESGIQQLKNEY